MTDTITFSITVFTGFFAIMNPIANTPIFIGLVGDMDKASKRKIARTATITAFLIVVFSIFLGKYIFQLFGMTIPAFKITGGILIFYVGFEMLMSKKSKIRSLENVEIDESVAISPLAIPILAGPGTIITALNNITGGSYIHIAIVILIFALMVYLTYLVFSSSDLIVKKIGNNLITVIGKIMGLILAIMGTGMTIEGIKLAFID
jgi:multiple antibiotic resistance protein